MATITKTLQYQSDDGSWSTFDQTTQSDLSRVYILLDFDGGTYQVRIPGYWSDTDIQNTIDSETTGYTVRQDSASQQVKSLQNIVSS